MFNLIQWKVILTFAVTGCVGVFSQKVSAQTISSSSASPVHIQREISTDPVACRVHLLPGNILWIENLSETPVQISGFDLLGNVLFHHSLAAGEQVKIPLTERPCRSPVVWLLLATPGGERKILRLPLQGFP